MASRTVPRHLAVGVALVVALAACSSASAPTPTTTPTPTLTVAPAITSVPTTTPTAAPTATPIPDLIMTTGSATITVTNVGVATVKNVAPLATAFSDPQVITPDGVLDLTWEVFTPVSGGAETISELHLTFKPDPSGTTHISANGARVTIGFGSYPVKANMYVTSDQYSFDTTADSGGYPAQADCTVTSTRSAFGGVSGTVTCAGTFFIPEVQAHRSFTAKATFWAEPTGGVGPP